MTATCPYSPSRESYSSSIPSGVVSVATTGGVSRCRDDFSGKPYIVNVQWVCDAYKFEALQNFFFGSIVYGSESFEIDLRLDYSESETYSALLVPGTWSISQAAGPLTVISAQLEVTPNPTDTERDETILDLYEYYTSELPEVLAALEKLVNVDFPAVIPES